MFAVVLLIILILIVIFIVYTYYHFFEVKYEKVKNVKIKTNLLHNEKMISYYTEYLSTKNDSVYIVYFDLPINSVYWTLGIHKDEKCIDSVNMGMYQTIETGDTLAIIISNNRKAAEAGKSEIIKEHVNRYPYKKLMTHFLESKSEFYILFESFSNKFMKAPKLIIEEIIFDKITFEEFTKPEIKLSFQRQCEDITLFNKSLYGYIDDNYEKITVNKNTIEINSPLECLTNRSDIVDFTNKGDKNFKIVAIDHFKSRAALHSHLIFYNADDNRPFRVEITGKVSDSINNKQSISTRRISFKIQDNINRFYCIEYIYYDFVSGGKVNEDTIIPFSFYIEK